MAEPESEAAAEAPLYLRVAAALREDLAHRRISPGARLPSERSLSQRYHVNLEQDRYGYFLTERYSYDERFGTTFEGKISLIQRWNIWETSRDITIAWDDGTDAEGDPVTHLPLATCLNDGDCRDVATDDGLAANHCW